MGVLQRFERRLGGLVEGAFARVFGGNVQPVEVAAALQRETDDRRVIVGEGRYLVPNEFVVELGPTDAGKLEEYDAPLRRELAAMVSEHCDEQGYSTVGPIGVRFEQVPQLDTGIFRVRSAVVEAQRSPGTGSVAVAPLGVPYLLVPAAGARGERRVELTGELTRIGRSSEADVRLSDTAVSRLHAELRRLADEVVLVDLGSTNGTSVNGARVREARLRDGDRIGVGSSSLTFRLET